MLGPNHIILWGPLVQIHTLKQFRHLIASQLDFKLHVFFHLAIYKILSFSRQSS
jgi:hypothetical protein